MSQVFYANRAAVYKAERRKNGELIQAIGYSIIFTLIFSLRSKDEMMYRLAWKYETSRSTVESWFTAFLIILAFFIVMSIVLFCINNSEHDRLLQSYVSINDNTVSGTAVAFDAKDLYPFSCTLDEIVHVESVGMEGANLNISTERVTYSCYQIENAAMVASYINKARATLEQKTGDNEVTMRVRELDAYPRKKKIAFCKCCGSTMPDGETVCSQCGAVNQIVDEVIPIVEGEYLTCPHCGQSKMRNNRTVCYNCGVKFKK